MSGGATGQVHPPHDPWKHKPWRAQCQWCGEVLQTSPAGYWFHSDPWRRKCADNRHMAKPEEWQR